MENDNPKFKIIRNEKPYKDFQISIDRNNEIENMIISAANLSKSSEVKVYFKNVPAEEYNLGYKKFCGIRVEDMVFYNPSLFDLYPKFINFIYLNQNINFSEIFFENKSREIYFSKNKNNFKKSKPLLRTNIFINLDITFDEMVNVLDKITNHTYNKKVLKILTIRYIKS